ncbi:MAG: hypothetical protein HOH43_18160 [Candidatus Latescibacteria bacterium]|nr:hypothetical protein [Candidatus Latescibacterota bacterium]
MNFEYLVSNEIDYARIGHFINNMPSNRGVYIGVGPDQNFSYIAGVQPVISFIVDYRRENLLLHHLFRVLFLLSGSREEYLTMLFSRPFNGEDSSDDRTLGQLIEYIERTAADPKRMERNLSLILPRVIDTTKGLSSDDILIIREMYRDFSQYDLNLRCRLPTVTSGGLPYPTFKDFLLSGDDPAVFGNFLANGSSFEFIKQQQSQNLIVPITGDFSGRKTLSAIKSFCQERELGVACIYISSVEYRLFNEGLFHRYVSNISDLPLNENSLLIRAHYNKPEACHPEQIDGELFTTIVQKTDSFIEHHRSNAYKTYFDVGSVDYLR